MDHVMTPTPQENTALVRRFLTDVIAGSDHDALDAFVTDDAVDHNLVFGDHQGREPADLLGQSVLAAVGDIDLRIEASVAEGDTVAVRATVRGTHQGSLLDLAPTGKSVEIAYVWFFRIKDGQIAEVWSLPDGLGLVQQLDAIPESTTD
jgi:predicted ester cyclase